VNRLVAIAILGWVAFPHAEAHAEPPDIAYIYPAGGQRGQTVPVRVGGYYFHGQADFEMLGAGVKFQPVIRRTETLWFEGPLIHQPLSQQGENYPKDHLNEITVAKEAELGQRLWRCWTSQGATRNMKFVIGDLPEVMEKEMAGRPIAHSLVLPVTANGRIFPREDVDVWTFSAKAGETIVCDAAANRFGSPLNIVLAIRDAAGHPVASNKFIRGGDPIHWFKVPRAGRYEVHIRDAKFWGLQNHIYRLTLKRGPHILHHFPLGARRGTTESVEITGPGLPPQKMSITFPNDQRDLYAVSIKNRGMINFAIGDFPEQVEPASAPVTLPVVFNGRISKPGETDIWKVQLLAKQKILLDLAAAQLGTPLDAVLTLSDANGKQLATNDDRSKGQPDPRLEFTAPSDGTYLVRIRDRFSSRGGPRFAYRLTLAGADQPNFAVTLPASFYNVARDPKGGLETNADEIAATEKRIAEIAEALKAVQAVKQTDRTAAGRIRELTTENRMAVQLVRKLKAEDAKRRPKFKVALNRTGGFKGEVRLNITGLPKQVAVRNLIFAAGVSASDLEFIAPANTPIDVHQLKIEGVGKLDGKEFTRTAIGPDGTGPLLLGVVPTVPFKHQGIYRIITGLPGGTTFHRKYSIDRGGFNGSLTARLADKQIRHLQGVTDRVISISEGADQFAFPVQFPARIEVGRTSRVCLMLVGELTDFDGTKHKVSYTSRERNDQLISVAAEGLVAVQTKVDSFAATPGTEFTLPVVIRREPIVRLQAMRVELVFPAHVKGISVEPVELGPNETKVNLKVRLTDRIGPFNAPLKIRATTTTAPRHMAEKEIEFVAPSR
jgi:hypothetical protein